MSKAFMKVLNKHDQHLKTAESGRSSLTERPSYKTDQLVEEIISKSSSKPKEIPRLSINENDDWELIDILQKDIKESYKKLEEMKATPSDMENRKIKFHGKEKEKYKQLRTQQRSQTRLDWNVNKSSEKLKLKNLVKERKSVITPSLGESNRIQDFENAGKYEKNKNSEIVKNAHLMLEELETVPVLKKLSKKSFSSTSRFLNQIKSQDYESCLTSAIEFIREIIEYEKISSQKEAEKSSGSSISTIEAEAQFESPIELGISSGKEEIPRQDKSKRLQVVDNVDESDLLLEVVSSQSARISKLNTEISDAVNSMRKILYSPIPSSPRSQAEHFFESSNTIKPTHKQSSAISDFDNIYPKSVRNSIK
ncbi:unnamed protein product [Blepharisma stoltei]|uniref:Uncharacterized protein n=1 Tax=Blepharisma stoltei TaxID=1481888 RepID=A0AAU9JBR9_9CILI|nr:unnamed protein product [Blepharisma stoltei]